MKSMTGYGEASQQVGGAKITVQLRSLNHRHLDLQLRVPREYLPYEEEIRKLIRERVHRGRVDVFVNRISTDGRARRIVLDEDLLGQYLKSIQQAKKKFRLAGEVELGLVSRFPELFRMQEIAPDPAKEKPGLLRCVEVALRRLEQARDREGRQLKADMQSQIAVLKQIAAELEQIAAAAPRSSRTGGGEPQESPPGAECAVSKGDINEEVVRLKTHVAELGKVIQARDPVGKKIDFMLQEVQRELNTISSKLPHLQVVQLVLSGKERVEKIREQTQNVE